MPRVHLPHQRLRQAQLGAAFTSKAATARGLSRNDLNRAHIEQLSRGVYLDASAIAHLHAHERLRLRHLQHALTLAELMHREQFFSHQTAAVLWSLPVSVDAADPLDVSSSTQAHRMRRRGVRSRYLAEQLVSVSQVQGVRVTCPATTWALLAPELSQWQAVALGDAVLRHHRVPGTHRLTQTPLATREHLETVVKVEQRKHRGVLLQLLPLLSTASASAPESHLRLLLTEWGFAPEALDFDVWGPGEVLAGCSEIAYPSRRIAVEYEGDHHRTDKQQWNRDIEKYAAYQALGWAVVRVTAELLYRRPGALRAHLERVFAGQRGTR